MKKALFILFLPFLLISFSAQAQDEDVSDTVEVQPVFPGGEAAMYQFLGQNMTYPPDARDNNVQGRVYVSFVIEKDGSITDIKVLRGIGSGCDKEAIRVVKSMPKWTPGFHQGKKVRVRYNLPIVFKLTKSGKEEKSKKKKKPKKERGGW